MGTLRFKVYMLAAFCAGLVLIPSSCHGHSGLDTKCTAGLFIFGDSLFDAGNNNYINTTTRFQANFWPYGQTFFNHSTGRPSNGRLIPDFIAEFAKLPSIPPYLQPGFDNYVYGVNFASAGAGALPETYQGFVIDLKTQLRNFKNVEKQLRCKVGDKEAYELLSKSIYLISIGSNDHYTSFARNSSLFLSHSHEHVGMVIGNITNVIKEIYKIGGRKFGFLSLGPINCSPGSRVLKPGNIGTCVEELTAPVKLHNRLLAKSLLKLQSHLQGFKYSNANFYNYLTKRINHPSKYGFKEGKAACCGSGPYRGIMSCGGKRGVTEYELCHNVTEYVFFDSGHPTERVYQQVSELWWSDTRNVPGSHMNLKELFEV